MVFRLFFTNVCGGHSYHHYKKRRPYQPTYIGHTDVSFYLKLISLYPTLDNFNFFLIAIKL